MRFGLNLKSLKHKQVNNADFDCAFGNMDEKYKILVLHQHDRF